MRTLRKRNLKTKRTKRSVIQSAGALTPVQMQLSGQAIATVNKGIGTLGVPFAEVVKATVGVSSEAQKKVGETGSAVADLIRHFTKKTTKLNVSPIGLSKLATSIASSIPPSSRKPIQTSAPVIKMQPRITIVAPQPTTAPKSGVGLGKVLSLASHFTGLGKAAQQTKIQPHRFKPPKKF